jgi:putative zinc finger protein
MEHAPLRPVPIRPAGPVDPAAAAREVAAALPALAPLEARALALVALADRPRAQVAGMLDIEEKELGSLLAAARKELRQTITQLAGSGWCERAEALISDRLDGVVREPDARRLDVHLRNCPRCVEHERRLVQATDALLAGIAPARPAPTPPELAPAPPSADAPVTAVLPGEAAGRADEADGVPDEARTEGVSDEAVKEGAPTALAGPDAAGEPAAPTSDQIAAAAEVLIVARTRRQLAAAVTWNAMVAIAVILTLAAIALTLAGILGAKL